MDIKLSEDGSGLVVEDREVQALCHFCGIAAPYDVPYHGFFNNPLLYNKPKKWALIGGGTKRKPKRFFVCTRCSGLIVGTSKHDS